MANFLQGAMDNIYTGPGDMGSGGASRQFAKTFNPQDADEVKKMQGMLGLKTDGILGPETHAALRKLQGAPNDYQAASGSSEEIGQTDESQWADEEGYGGDFGDSGEDSYGAPAEAAKGPGAFKDDKGIFQGGKQGRTFGRARDWFDSLRKSKQAGSEEIGESLTEDEYYGDQGVSEELDPDGVSEEFSNVITPDALTQAMGGTPASTSQGQDLGESITEDEYYGDMGESEEVPEYTGAPSSYERESGDDFIKRMDPDYGPKPYNEADYAKPEFQGPTQDEADFQAEQNAWTKNANANVSKYEANAQENYYDDFFDESQLNPEERESRYHEDDNESWDPKDYNATEEEYNKYMADTPEAEAAYDAYSEQHGSGWDSDFAKDAEDDEELDEFGNPLVSQGDNIQPSIDPNRFRNPKGGPSKGDILKQSMKFFNR